MSAALSATGAESKKSADSSATDWGESDPWPTFRVSVRPKEPRRESGDSYAVLTAEGIVQKRKRREGENRSLLYFLYLIF